MASNWTERTWWPETDDGDVTFARDKLDNLLLTLKENPEKAKESSKYKDDLLGGNKEQDKDKYRSTNFKAPSEAKKRKRRPTSDDEEGIRDSYVIKVFERSVDFGQFGENAPLYPMARAWIRNMNQGNPSTWNDIPNVDDENDVADQLPDCFYSLPKPNDGFSDNEVRVPAIQHTDDAAFVLNSENPTKTQSPEGLLEQHITRWRNIRRKWKASCRENEARYMDSFLILKEMYDKYYKEMP